MNFSCTFHQSPLDVCSNIVHKDTSVTTDFSFVCVVSFLKNLYGPCFAFITKCVFDNTDMDGTPCIEWCYLSDKQKYKQNISHISFSIGRVVVTFIQFVSFAIQFLNFIFLSSIKIPLCWYNEINTVLTTSVYEETRYNRLIIFWYKLIPHDSPWNYTLQVKQLLIKGQNKYSPLRDIINIVI